MRKATEVMRNSKSEILISKQIPNPNEPNLKQG